ncbi:MAG: BamA/TamA family outer membrane protein [Candidatus Neomarinimicrobiota bacterium]
MKRLIIILLALLVGTLFGQSFGQNKVQYRNFDWSYIESPHFDIYYYGDDKSLAEFTAEVSEEAYEQVSKHLRWELNKRVSIIIYNSHNDFQQTNVVWEYMAEGILGVTELFKNRVVVPFEGNYELFRHTVHHELVHAVVNDMIYGGNIQSVISGRVRLRVPLWANEGLAEFLSSNWDNNADMILRDLSINERIPSLEELNYYFAYKGGQSVWRFLAEKYGREKIGEVFLAMKRTQDAEAGFRRAMGTDFEGLTEQWHKYLKKEYWGDIAGRDEVEDIAKRLTDHKKDRNYYNISPALSPDASKIVMLTDRSGYADIVLIDAIDGRLLKTLVKGNRSVDFEELKWLQPGVSWSPDGRQVIIAAKAGENDVFYLIDVENDRTEKIILDVDFDGLFTADWSPDGSMFAFVGSVGSACDIYTYELKTRELTNLTNDIYSDSEPAWSPDGTKIAFISDHANDYVTSAAEREYRHGDFQKDIFIYNRTTGLIEQVTATDYNENYPTWARTRDLLLYTADYNGISNLHYYDLTTGDQYPVTNVLTGIYQLSLSRDDQTLVFSGYSDLGWDLYSIAEPLNLTKTEVLPTKFIINRDLNNEVLVDLRSGEVNRKELDGHARQDYSRYIFSPEYEPYNDATFGDNQPAETVLPDSARTTEGDYITHAYKTRFSLDVVDGQATFSNVFGYSGTTMFMFSDILGDHQIIFGTELVLTLENSDYFFTYAYLKRRADYYLTGYHTADFFGDGYFSISRLRNYGVSTAVSFPLNRFNRFDLQLTWSHVKYTVFDRDYNPPYDFIQVFEEQLNTVIPTVSWVLDNTIYGYTGPIDGFRQNFSVMFSPSSGGDGLSFQTIMLDTRRYLRFKRDYSLAGRLLLGVSRGADAQKFMLGGVSNWVFGYGETNGEEDTGSYREGILNSDNDNMLKDAYFSVFAMPVRGTRYYERYGTNVALANLELRFPFINYFALGFPLKMIFGNIRGHAFFDIGAAWDSADEFDDFSLLQAKYGTNIYSSFKPTVSSFGYGMKINFGYFLLRIDSAWDINHDGYSKPQYYLSLGSDW